MNKNLMIICVDINDADYVYRIIDNCSEEFIDSFQEKYRNLLKVSKSFSDLRDFYEAYSYHFPYEWENYKIVLNSEVYKDSKYAEYGLKREDVESALNFYVDELPTGEYGMECPPHTIVSITVYQYSGKYDIRN